MYKDMVFIRVFEERVADLVEAGEIKTPCHLCIGQEAIAVGVCSTLRREDYVWGGHRSHGHYLAKGGKVAPLMAELFGKTTGCSAGRGGSMHLAAPEIGILGTVPLVAATIPLAVGTAMAAKLCGHSSISVSFFGDGAIEEGHFHESVNLAAVYKLPVVFVCENNFYSSHLALLQRRAKDNIDQASVVHGIAGFRIDGNNIRSVFEAASAAVDRARAGKGPSFIECRTYRWRGHVGPSWDMDVGVKRKDELALWMARDPIKALEGDLALLGFDHKALETVASEARQQVDAAVQFARESPYPQPERLLQHVVR
jgi:pyruvate dehydrogenase E1 component alpha subunit